ncbi:MAG: HAD family hydrolase [Firmicutes bacterium]|nr:HAD family hydrolase [Bacillota bacterium]
MNDLSKYLIMSDLDGTFTGSSQERNIEAIERFKSKGGLFSFSSGRCPDQMRSVFPLFDKLINSPALLCNGGCIYDPESGEYICETVTDGKLLRSLIKEVKQRYPEVGYVFYEGSDYKFYMNAPLEDAPTDIWHKTCFSAPHEILVKIETLVGEMFGKKLHCMYSGAEFLEVFSSRFSKGGMIQFIKGWYAAKGRRITVCAAGDYGNDIDMLISADRAFCPSNALSEVREICEKVLCHHNDGAIAELVELLEAE